MATARDFKIKKKKGPGILPLLVIGVIGFLAYRANPEYWQQGKLFEDLKNGGFQRPIEESPQEDVVKAPVVETEAEPELDPDVSYDGSIRGAKTIPRSVIRTVNPNDPMYGVLNSKFKFVYAVLPDTEVARDMVKEVRKNIDESELRDTYRLDVVFYPDNDKTLCKVSVSKEYICNVCDRRFCVINTDKGEYLPIKPSVENVLATLEKLRKQPW